MLEAALTRWGSVIELFFASPAALLSGSTSSFSIVGGVSLAFLIVGVLLALLLRVRQAFRLALPALVSLVMPFLFAIASIARDAARKRPAIWLVGIGIIGFALLGIMVEITLPVSLRGN